MLRPFAMRRLLPLLLLLLTAGADADALRAFERADARVVEEERRLAEVRGEQDAHAARIEAAKAESMSMDRLLPRAALQEELARSQQLAERHAAVLRRLEDARRIRREAALRLLELGGDEEKLRRARQAIEPERPVLVSPVRPPGPTSDPRELRERADLLRDRRDRALRNLHEVRERLALLREEEQVAKELSRFLSEDSLFHEGGRVLRVKRSTTTSPPPAPAPGDAGPIVDGEVGAGDPSDDFDSGAGFDPTGPQPPPPPPPAPDAPTTVTRIGARPLGVADNDARDMKVLRGDESIGQLARRERELRALVEILEREAEALEKRARELH